MVLGAYKAISIKKVEAEVYIPPIDIWLNARLTAFRQRLKVIRLAEKLCEKYEMIRHSLKNHRRNMRRLPQTTIRPPTKPERYTTVALA